MSKAIDYHDWKIKKHTGGTMHIYTVQGKYEYDDGGADLQIATENVSTALSEARLLIEGHERNGYTVTLIDWQNGQRMYEYYYSCEDNVAWNSKEMGLMDMVIANEFEDIRSRLASKAAMEDAKSAVETLERQLREAKIKLEKLSK